MYKQTENKEKRKITAFLGLFILISVLALCGCEDKKQTAPPTGTPTPTATSTPSPTPTPDPWKSYEKAGEREVYRIPVKKLAKGGSVIDSKMAGDYMVLRIIGKDEDIPGSEWAAISLLRPAFSGETAELMPDHPVNEVYLAADGTVFTEDSETGRVRVFDNTLKEITSFLPEGITGPSVVDVTSDGHIWLCDTKAGILYYLDRTGKTEKSFETGAGRRLVKRMGENGTKQYFRAFEGDGLFTDVLLCVDFATGTVEAQEEKLWDVDMGKQSAFYILAQDMFCFGSSRTWYLHDLWGGDRLLMFPKYFNYECLDLHAGNLILVRGNLPGEPDEAYEPGGCRVYDISGKKILGELKTAEIENCAYFSACGLNERHVILHVTREDSIEELVFWDLGREPEEELKFFFDLKQESPKACLEKLCAEYGREYGISYTPGTLKTFKDSEVDVYRHIDYMNMVARGIANSPEEFKKDDKGIALYLENFRGHERGHSAFVPHLFTRISKAQHGGEFETAFINMVDAMRKGEEWFDCGTRIAYDWCVGMFAPWFYPASTGCIKTSTDYYDNSIYKDGRGKIVYTVPPEEAKQVMADFEQHICDILDDCFADDYTDLEKAIALYEYVTQNWTYDYVYYDHIDDPEWWNFGSLYRCFEEGQGICWEIGGIYDYLLMQCGIECERISGYNHELGESHAWTFAKLNDEWYNIDPTWGLSNNGKSPLAYFCFTDKVREERDNFNVDTLMMNGTDEFTRKTWPDAATDTRFEALWEGTYVGLDRVNKDIIYLDKDGALHRFAYEK